MPEPRIVPAGRAMRPVPMPDGTLEDIRTRARRRRAGRAAALGSAGATALALVAVTGLVGTADGRDDSLRIGPATRSASPSPVQPQPTLPAGALPSAAAQVAAPALEAPARAVPAHPQRPQAVAAPPQAVREVQEQVAPHGPERRAYDPDAVWTDDRVLTLPPECESTGRGSFAGWCLAALAGNGEDRILLSACRVRGVGDGRLDWVDSQRVRLEIRDASGKRVWSYDPKVRPEAHSQVVPADSCAGWEVPYAQVDEVGRPLGPGDYTLVAGTTAEPISGFTVDAPFRVAADDEPIAAPQQRQAMPRIGAPTLPRLR